MLEYTIFSIKTGIILEIMKNIILRTLFIIIIGILFYWNFSQNENKKQISDILLTDIESIAACEVSSNNSLNTGYCIKRYDSGDYICVITGNPYSSRCIV